MQPWAFLAPNTPRHRRAVLGRRGLELERPSFSECHKVWNRKVLASQNSIQPQKHLCEPQFKSVEFHGRGQHHQMPGPSFVSLRQPLEKRVRSCVDMPALRHGPRPSLAHVPAEQDAMQGCSDQWVLVASPGAQAQVFSLRSSLACAEGRFRTWSSCEELDSCAPMPGMCIMHVKQHPAARHSRIKWELRIVAKLV